MSELAPGDRVVVDVGRHRGTRAEVIELHTVGTPSGGRVALVRLKRARSGDLFLFPTDVRLETDEPRPAIAVPVGFGASGFEGDE